eukprot:Selendium_serpulae@DN4884_c0_g1_i5.p1
MSGVGASCSESDISEQDNIEKLWDWDDGALADDLPPARSLIDCFVSSSVEDVWAHMVSNGFDICKLRGRLPGFNHYSHMVLINYLRDCQQKGIDVKATVDTIHPESDFWKNEAYMKPTVQDDRLLWEGPEDESSDEEDVVGNSETTKSSSIQPVVIPEMTLEQENRELRQKVNSLAERIREMQQELVPRSQGTGTTAGGRAPAVDELSGKRTETEDSLYFSAYSFLDIHREMILDSVRTSAYHSFIVNNPEEFKDKIVLDVGCGTGILSMFCLQAGAKHVVAVDAASKTIKIAKKIAEDNGFSSKITFLDGKLEKNKIITKPDGSFAFVSNDAKQVTGDPFQCDIIVFRVDGVLLVIRVYGVHNISCARLVSSQGGHVGSTKSDYGNSRRRFIKPNWRRFRCMGHSSVWS